MEPGGSICSGMLEEGEDETTSSSINVQIFVPELQIRKCLTVGLDELVWDVKRKLHAVLNQPLPQAFNYGLFLPPCDGRAGKFLLEDRPLRDYPFHDCVPYLELKYKKRVYKMLNLDEKQLKNVHTKSNLKKFMEYVQNKNAEKVEKWCAQGLDANFHDSSGETPLTVAAGVANNRLVIMALIGGGAHIDFRNTEGQTAMHKAAFLSSVENVRSLLELGASPNYRDMIGLTPLYYNMLTTDSSEEVCEMLLKEAAEHGVTDMHGNHEIHQACKNGLVKHVEHLLYYGASADATNVNGNTPLHVCAVNSRPDAARVLLFRGASNTIVNKQGQTALHVAHIVGSAQVAEVIANHSPTASVPYRGTPQYSTRRRLSSSTIGRRRSFSQSSVCSTPAVPVGDYRVPQGIPTGAPSPAPSRVTIATPSEYGTMRRYNPEQVKAPVANAHEVNIPRILVIPRGPKGFGFILRGAKHAEAANAFEPTPFVPGLQFFEGVDMSGMAMRAGLRPGDFLLHIDGVDVTRASHEEVVRLIQAAGDTITLKVITVDANAAHGQPLYAPANYRQRHHSVGRAAGLIGPPIPTRLSTTSLSMRQPHGFRLHHGGTVGEFGEEYYAPGRCASVVHRPTASRRISAAELESLMIRQSTQHMHGTSTFQPIPYDMHHQQDPMGSSQLPKKFTSVSDMKRRKQANYQRPVITSGLPRSSTEYQTFVPDSAASIYGGTTTSMKHFSTSSPDLMANVHHNQAYADDPSDYSKPFRPTSRPKTPPPPPPPSQPSQYSQAPVPPPPLSSVTHSTTSSKSSKGLPPVAPPSNVPPPPPPPPPAMLMAPSKPSSSATSNGTTRQAPPPPRPDVKPSSGITADALRSVKLHKAESAPSTSHTSASLNSSSSSNSSSGGDFQSDLRNALAKRRSKVAMEDDDDDKTMRGSTSTLSALSLRESVRESVKKPSGAMKPQHSPPVGIMTQFGVKKDSGYASSRTSLEPSECGELQGPSTSPHPHFTLDDESTPPSSGHRVAVLSAQIEDSCYANSSTLSRKTIDTMSLTSTLSTISSTSSSSAGARRHVIEPPLPPVDYDDDPDSGTGDSDGDSHGGAFFHGKSVTAWSGRDVACWLMSLSLYEEYGDVFSRAKINGASLARFDRSAYTSLGVTRIAHRQKMESSLKMFLNNNNHH